MLADKKRKVKKEIFPSPRIELGSLDDKGTRVIPST